MKLTFLGTGAAFTVGDGNYNSNMLLEKDAKHNLLIDCGSDARHALHELKLTHRDIQSVYISHLHADHVGGIEWLAFNTRFDELKKRRLDLYISEDMITDIWNKVLAGGLSSLAGIEANLSTYFKVKPIKKQQFFWQKIKFTLVPTIHAMNGFTKMPSYGLFFTVDGLKVFITTDTQFKPDYYQDYYRKADIIFHDCEVRDTPSGVHSNYRELITLDASIKNKMWLYHYYAHKLPDAKKDGFRGFVKKGQCFDFKKKKSLV